LGCSYPCLIHPLIQQRRLWQDAAEDGEIDLFALDEAGFCLWMAVSYSYFLKGEQNGSNKLSIGENGSAFWA
jgi:hypothetical protein